MPLLLVQNLLRTLTKRFVGDRHVLYTMGTNLLVMVFAIGPAILAARALGPGGRGELAAALVWSSLLSAIAQLGLPQALTYSAAARTLQAPELLSGAVVMGVIQGLVLASVTWLVLPVVSRLRPELVPSLRVVALLIPLLLIATYASAVLQGLSRFAVWNASRAIAACAYPAALVVALALGTTSVPRILVFLVAATLLSTTIVLVLFVAFVARPGALRSEAVKRLLAYGLRAYWGNLAWLANTRLDQFVISQTLPLAPLGHYAVAASVAGGLLPVSAAFASVTFAKVPPAPAAARAAIIRSGATRAVAVTGIMAAVLMVAAPWLIPAVFGSAFSESVLPARVLLAGAVLLGLNYVLSDALRALNHPSRVAATETAGLFVTALLLWLLVPRFGIVGASLACCAAYAVIAAVLVHQVRRFTAPTATQAPALP